MTVVVDPRRRLDDDGEVLAVEHGWTAPPARPVNKGRPAVRPALMDVLRPAWHADAACRGDGPERWMLEGRNWGKLAELRQVCAGCPVAADCLRQALDEPPYERLHGPVRLGLGASSWPAVRKMVNVLDPQTDDDWRWVAYCLTDGVAVARRHDGGRVVELLPDVAA